MNCADCNGPIGQDNGPPDGWQLEDGRTVCHQCCIDDLRKMPELASIIPPRHTRQALDMTTIRIKPSWGKTTHLLGMIASRRGKP